MPRPTDAAERLRQMKSDIADQVAHELESCGYISLASVVGVREIIAKAIAAEHPADDGEAIDAKFLRSVGATKHEHPAKWTFHRKDELPIGLWHVDDGWKAMLMHNMNWQTQIVRGLKTRGDLRRLASALGINLEEPK